MDLGWLDDFLALADSGNFSRAAGARHLTQPAFSRRIKALEDWVGAPLFDRTRQPIALTEAGQRFHPAADDVLRRLKRGREEAAASHRTATATLRFAATHSLSLGFFPDWLHGIEAQQILPAIRLHSDTGLACEQALQQGHCDFLLAHHPAGAPEPLDPRHFRSLTVAHDLLVPVAAGQDENIALPGSPETPLPFLAYSDASVLARATGRVISDRPVWLRVVFTSPQAGVLKAMALDGRGMAWLPQSMIAGDLALGRLRRVGSSEWDIAVDVRLTRPRHRLSAAAEEFWARLG